MSGKGGLGAVSNALGQGLDTIGASQNAVNGETRSAVIDGLSVAANWAEMAGHTLGSKLNAGATSLSLANDCYNIKDSIDKGQKPSDSDIVSVLGNLSALGAAAAALSGPESAVVAATLGVASLALSGLSLILPDDSTVIVDGLEYANGLLNDAKDFWGDKFNDLIDFADNLVDLGSNFIDGLVDDLGGWLDDFGDWIDGLISPLLYDPIALDLDGDGAISLIADKTGSVYFDHDCDGVAFRSSWVSSNDGILVYDRNNNGTIDNGSELFGNFTPLSNSTANSNLATDGFNALSDFDTNNDGIISNLDENFDKLQIWQDLNSNGISEANELKTLNELGIENLNLNAIQSNKDLGNGNSQILQSSYTKTDGTTGLIADLNFSVDTINRKFTDENELNLTEADLARANIKGSGFLRDLRISCALNEELANLIDTYSVATTKQSQLNLLDDIITKWAETNSKFINLNLLVA